MPVYAVELNSPVNLSGIESLHKSAEQARAVWESDLGSREETPATESILGMSANVSIATIIR